MGHAFGIRSHSGVGIGCGCRCFYLPSRHTNPGNDPDLHSEDHRNIHCDIDLRKMDDADTSELHFEPLDQSA